MVVVSFHILHGMVCCPPSFLYTWDKTKFHLLVLFYLGQRSNWNLKMNQMILCLIPLRNSLNIFVLPRDCFRKGSSSVSGAFTRQIRIPTSAGTRSNLASSSTWRSSTTCRTTAKIFQRRNCAEWEEMDGWGDDVGISKIPRKECRSQGLSWFLCFIQAYKVSLIIAAVETYC